VDIDLDALSDVSRATRRVEEVRVPSRFPSALFDLAFVTPRTVHSQDLAFALRHVDALVEEVELFDVYEGAALPEGTRSLTYSVRVSSSDRTLREDEVAATRQALIDAGAGLGATLR
jgi:phenylalanyl-tRNA synthetase beta chain